MIGLIGMFNRVNSKEGSVFEVYTEKSEYCKYILKMNAVNSKMPVDIKGRQNYLKTNFLNELLILIEDFKKLYKIKEEKFSYDQMIIGTIDSFLSPDLIFVKHKRDEQMDKLYKHTSKMFKLEKDNLKKGNKVSLDHIFEVVNNMIFMLANTYVCIMENQKIISYKTSDVDVMSVLAMVQEYLKVFEKKVKYNKKVTNQGKVILKIPEPVFVIGVGAISCTPISFVTMSSIMGKLFLDFYFRDKAEREEIKFYYFMYVIMATYTRNKELREACSYGW